MNMDRINRFVLKKQHLADDSKIDDIVQVVRDIGGLHAQVPQTPYLSFLHGPEILQKKIWIQNSTVKRISAG
ncbi:MAG: hypothetical protein FIB07_14495 [Candidatus Methanoperedens sp.]|nr:hypothetical protein [Candidatus Methanoperedens sp.]